MRIKGEQVRPDMVCVRLYKDQGPIYAQDIVIIWCVCSGK